MQAHFTHMELVQVVTTHVCTGSQGAYPMVVFLSKLLKHA